MKKRTIKITQNVVKALAYKRNRKTQLYLIESQQEQSFLCRIFEQRREQN